MEVHAHTHSLRKKWTHYFWEFLMLFLAITLSFFVENKREHIVERLRAKQFAKSLIDDLSRDSTELHNCRLHSNIIADAIDSLRELLRGKNFKNIKGNHLYYYGRQLINNHPFIPYDATMEQLKNSGSLRYFKNPSLLDKITEYDRTTRRLVFDQGNDVRTQYVQELQARFFDINQIELIKIKNGTDWSFENDSALHIQTGLLIYGPTELQELKQFARLKSSTLRNFSRRTEPMLEQIRGLIAELKKEYHLK